MLLRNPTLLLLFCGQALYWSCSLIGITLTALVGVQLAPLNSLATLPLALLVLGNLLANALKYSGGDLDVTLDGDGTITLSNAAPGLDEVQVGRLFDRFYTVETGRHSTGLGLSIARALTERMGGTIAARYEDGRLRVELRFPEDA